jgi:hypothetical protein
MIKAGKNAESHARISDSETTVIVNRKTAVFVTRDRAQGQPAYDNSPLKNLMHFRGIARI